MRIFRKISLFFIILINLSSCTLTNRLWESGYEDRVKYFLVTQNGLNIVFLGDKYHYILSDRSGLLKEMLFSKYRYIIYIDPENTFINLFSNNRIEANITLKTNTNSPPLDAVNHLKNHGFQYNHNHQFFRKLRFYGTRYLASRKINYYVHSLNRSYILKVKEKDHDANAVKVALTPITMTIDTGLLLGKVILAPICDSCDLF